MSSMFFKVFSLVVKTITKPLITWVAHYKRSQIKESNSKIDKFFAERFTWLGQKVNYYTISINRRFFKLSNSNIEIGIPPLSEDKALEKGAEAFGEILVYSIMLVLPIIEIYRQSKNATAKEKAKEDFIKNMRNDVDQLVLENEEIENTIKGIKQKLCLL